MSTKRFHAESSAFRSETEKFIESMDGLRWLVHLDGDDMDAMLNDVAEALTAHTGKERRSHIAYALWDWKATAEAQADPDVLRRLIEPVAADFEDREFTPDELAKIKQTRRRSPRTGEARA